MTNKTRRHIWPLAVMSLVAFGVFAVVVALSLGGAQPASAHDCDTITDPVDRAACLTVHEQQGENHDQETPNTAPVVAMAPGDVMLMDGGEAEVIDLSSVFTDADGDTLTYAAGAAPGGVVSAAVSGSELTISPVGAGAAVVTVTANDGNDGIASVSINVEVEVPVADRFGIAFDSATPDQSVESRGMFTDPDSGLVIESLVAIVRSSDNGFPHVEKVQYEVTAVDRLNNPLAEDATLSVEVVPNEDARILQSTNLDRAGLNVAGQEELEANLTIRATDGGTRSFDLSVECLSAMGQIDITISDKDLTVVGRARILCESTEPEPGPERTGVSDAFTVVSYGDWEYDDVTDGFILDSSSGNDHMVNDHHYERGLLRRDEPVIHTAYTLGVSDMETLRDMDDGSPRRAKDEPRGMLSREQRQYKNAYVEEGQRTIEVLAGQPHVQLTVTSKMSGPAYIRFLDSDMEPFGTDVDEEPMWRGADVVGLDSQGRLALNKQTALNKAMALAYDQYIIVTPGIVPGQSPANSYLVGAASQMNDDGEYIKDYNQGAFRFFNPCPEVGHHFYVEVYEASGKYLQTTEKIVCVPSPKPGPTGLEFKIDSQVAGEGVLTFEPALNAVGHTVLLIDASNRNIVEDGSVTATASMFNADTGLYTITFNERDNVGLNNGWTYHIVVIAEGAASQFTADAVRDYGVSWLGEDDVPLSTDPSDEPTRMHDLCMVENAEITALLSDCDTEPVPPAELGKPTNVMAVIDETDPGLDDIVVTWTDGANADVHHVYLVPTDFGFANIRQERITSGMTHTFMDVAPDTYIVAVQSTSPTTPGYEYAIAPGLITVGGQ